MKIPKLMAAAAAAAALFCAVPASAQTDSSYDTGVLQAQIDSLTRRLERQEKKTSGWEKVLANLPRITGYGQIGYEWNGTLEEATSSFNIMSVRIIFIGDIGPKVDYKFHFEVASPKLIDAFVRYKIHQGFSLQAGQFHTNFSLEGPLVPLDLESVDYAPIVKAICMQTHDTRDVGVAAYGTFGHRDGWNLVEYCAGVYNGEGKNKTDANKSKDFITRLKINPSKHLTLSGSFGYGERGETYVHNTRYAAGAWWHGERFYVRSEYLALHQNDAASSRKVDGWYASAGYWIGRLRPMLRYAWMNNALGDTAVRQSDYMAGLEFRFNRYLRLQANYTRTQYRNAGGSNIVSAVVTAAF